PQSSNVVYAGTQPNGVFRSSDTGGSWTPAVAGMNGTSIGAVAVDPSNPNVLYAGTTDYERNGSVIGLGMGVFKSTDGGASWAAANAGMRKLVVVSMAVDP